jgi:phage-related protein
MPNTYPSLTAKPVYPIDEQREDSSIKTSMEAGYLHTRARFTRVRKSWKFKYNLMSSTDKGTLDTFLDTVKGTVDSFTWTNPVNNTSYTVRFLTIPVFSNVYKGELFTVEINLQEV